MIPHHQVIAPISILAEIAGQLAKTHPIKLEPSHTPPQIHINQTSTFQKRLRRRRHPLSTPNNPSPSGYCQHSNYQDNCLRTLQRCTHSSVSLPPHLPKSTSIEHCRFGSNHCAAAATQRYTTVLHNQAIDSTPIFCGNCSRSHEDSANQARALPHTSQNSPRSHIAILETITVPPTSTDNTK